MLKNKTTKGRKVWTPCFESFLPGLLEGVREFKLFLKYQIEILKNLKIF
jgi:hypothetical protein